MLPTKAELIINELLGRGGFDEWWEEIDKETQEEIIAELNEIINKK